MSGVVARAVNLSSTGILVDAPTPTPCPVGSDVLCDVALPRGPRLLRGRVAHRRVLPSAKVGMGIEFVDLSPREAAELRTVVDESEEKPQRVKVRFRGTNHVVRARAVPTADGFRLVTALPFLKLDTEVDISLSPDASVSARGWVSQVTLEHGEADGAPRLRIDVSVNQPDPWRYPSSDALTPVVETIVDAVPEYVWEPDDLGVSAEPHSLDGPVEIAAPQAAYEAVHDAFQDDESEPTHVDTIALGPPLPTIREASGAMPVVEESDLTEVVTLEPRRSPWRALGVGMIAGAIVLAAFVGALILVKALGSKTPAPAVALAPRAEPVIAAPVVAPPARVVAAPPAPVAPSAAAAPSATAAEPEPAAAPVKPEAEAVAAATPATFTVALTGSLAGSTRYPLRDPDGVAFNLPHARATTKLGTYRPDVPGLKMVWVRALPGGGVHLRFFFSSSSPPPRVDLTRDAVRVAAR